MEAEAEDTLDPNNTDHLNNYDFRAISTWDYIYYSSQIVFTLIGLSANLILIYMITRNARMRTKTNIVLLHFAINDALFLCTNTHLVISIFLMFGADYYFYIYSDCIMTVLDNTFQLNAAIFLLVLISNTLMKSARVSWKALLLVVYGFAAVNVTTSASLCYVHDLWYIMHLVAFLFFVLLYLLLFVKEFNNCFKIWYRKDPLSERTRFRLNVARIYLYAWLSSIIIQLVGGFTGLRHTPLVLIAEHGLFASAYILGYVCYADKHFKICLLSLLQCKGAGDYDVDATITFGEESAEDERVNIRFGPTEATSHI